MLSSLTLMMLSAVTTDALNLEQYIQPSTGWALNHNAYGGHTNYGMDGGYIGYGRPRYENYQPNQMHGNYGAFDFAAHQKNFNFSQGGFGA